MGDTWASLPFINGRSVYLLKTSFFQNSRSGGRQCLPFSSSGEGKKDGDGGALAIRESAQRNMLVIMMSTSSYVSHHDGLRRLGQLLVGAF